MNRVNISTKISAEKIAENALLLTWPEHIDVLQHQEILTCEQQIKIEYPNAIIETIVSYNSLIIYYNFTKLTTVNLLKKLTAICQQPAKKKANTLGKNIEIPVYYGEEVGLDLANVSKATGLTISEIITIHSQSQYRAFALGFTPGFCYLASIKKALQLPRLATPRKKVLAGSVAIAEQQTAVYPDESPGGWHILGQTPQAMYKLERDNFTATINVGDTVSFYPITRAEFLQLGGTLVHE